MTPSVVVGKPSRYYYPCYGGQEVETEEGSDLPGTRGKTPSRILVAAETTFNPALASLGPQSQVDAPELGCPEAPSYSRDGQDAGPVSTQHPD